MIPLGDDHPAWRVVGAWIAARQRGEPRSILPLVVDDARTSEVRDDLAALAAHSGPLRTGAELVVDAAARALDKNAIDGLQLTLRGKTEAGEVVNVLTLARLEQGGDGVWRIARLLTDDERRCLADPAFLSLLATRP